MNHRRRIAYLPYQHLVSVLQPQSDPEVIYVRDRSGLPDGTKVITVVNMPERNALGVLIEHESFDPVQEGAVYPEHDDLLAMKYRAYRVVGETEVVPA